VVENPISRYGSSTSRSVSTEGVQMEIESIEYPDGGTSLRAFVVCSKSRHISTIGLLTT
jgi:hypothetical protein